MKYRYTDIDISLDKKHNGDINDFVSIEAIKSSITNIIETMKGSRRKRPEFGGNLWPYLFEPMDEITAQSIGEEVLAAIEIWETRIIIENVNINPVYDRNEYDITVIFKLKGMQTEEEFEFQDTLRRI